MSGDLSKIRILDIAHRANVSVGTVDRVIHKRAGVSAKTREKVLSIIDEMDYQPDLLARTLASRKTYRIASLIPEASSDSEFWAWPLAGLKKAHNQVKHYGLSHEIFLFNYFNRQSFKNAAEQINFDNYDGIVVAPVFADLAEEFVSRCRQASIPVIFINTNIFNLEKLSFIGQDSFRSGMVAAKLLDYGLCGKNIYVVNIMSDKGTNMHLISREEGFRSFFNDKAKKKRKIDSINIQGNDLQKIYEALSDHIIKRNKPKKGGAIFVTNSRVFLVAEFLKNMHIKNMRLVGYDLLDVNVAHLQEGTIDFLISQKPLEQGYRSYMTMFDHLVMKAEIPVYQYLPIDIITRENIDYYLG